jgi:hypothetical protein
MAISKKWRAGIIMGLIGGVMLPCLICSCALGYIAWSQYLQPMGLIGQTSPDADFGQAPALESGDGHALAEGVQPSAFGDQLLDEPCSPSRDLRSVAR